jgi:hypothetical protein
MRSGLTSPGGLLVKYLALLLFLVIPAQADANASAKQTGSFEGTTLSFSLG